MTGKSSETKCDDEMEFSCRCCGTPIPRGYGLICDKCGEKEFEHQCKVDECKDVIDEAEQKAKSETIVKVLEILQKKRDIICVKMEKIKGYSEERYVHGKQLDILDYVESIIRKDEWKKAKTKGE